MAGAVHGGEDAAGEDFVHEGADGGERHADVAAGELDFGPDGDGDVVPGGVEGGFEGEEGVEADDGGDAAAGRVSLWLSLWWMDRLTRYRLRT